MRKTFIDQWLLSWWRFPAIFCTILLLSVIPILSPFFENESVNAVLTGICGWIILLGILLAFAHIAGTTVYFFLRLNNMRALGQLTASFVIWAFGCLIFTKIAIATDPPSPYPPEEETTIAAKQKQHTATEALTGPAALCIYLPSADADVDSVYNVPNLNKLAQQHPDLLTQYLRTSPRWKNAANDDSFYIQPGHVVYVIPAKSGIPGSVHAAFRSMADGEQLPSGFTVMEPGDDIPEIEADDATAPYIALELGNRYYLLLAWVGTDNNITAIKGLNTALKAIDKELAPLADNPTTSTLLTLCDGKRRIDGNRTELRLSEPQSQYGIYQAEVFTNPGRPGTLILDILDAETRTPLLILTQAARFSADKKGLFRHDFPANASGDFFRSGNKITHQPYFVIKEGEAHKHFGIIAEVRFSPQGSLGSETELLLQKNYTVQAYEEANSPLMLQNEDLPITPQHTESATDRNRADTYRTE